MLRIHFVQYWFSLTNLACEEALYDRESLRSFVGIDLGLEPVPNSTTITKFRKLPNGNKLGDELFAKVGKATKNADKTRDPEMHQTRKGQQWHFGMKFPIGVYSQTGLTRSAVVTAANVHDKHALTGLLHGNEQRVYGDSAYASQKELIASKAPKARDFTNQRTRCAGIIDEAVRAKNRSALVGHQDGQRTSALATAPTAGRGCPKVGAYSLTSLGNMP
jgi:IS5 family transposase